MIEMRRLKNVLIFMQTILSFAQSGKNLIFILNFSCDLARLHGQRVILHHPCQCGDIDLVEEEI